MAVSHALMYSSVFPTGDYFLDGPQGVITDVLTLRLRPMRFRCVAGDKIRASVCPSQL
jgi:hypothetical protein